MKGFSRFPKPPPAGVNKPYPFQGNILPFEKVLRLDYVGGKNHDIALWDGCPQTAYQGGEHQVFAGVILAVSARRGDYRLPGF